MHPRHTDINTCGKTHWTSYGISKRVSYQDHQDDNADKQVLHKSLEWKQEHTINTHITKVVLN